ncbi:DUF6188 family protein [Rhodococcoides fascians]|uniref:DUF6188 family protein n=1 Tax=Rhodococcoides fascians TaxID=1828 RepID=UPI0024467B62|nr:DUF6188 family protein [Rhodococcus fascians]
MVGETIESIEFGFSLVLRTIKGYEIRMKSAFQVIESGLERFEGVPHESLSNNPVLGLLVGRKVRDAQASDAGGGLRIAFSDGARLEVPADPDYEAWTIAGPGGFTVVSVAGGGLASWD